MVLTTMRGSNAVKLTRIVFLVLSMGIAAALAGQTGAPTQKGTYKRIKVHGKSLEGNLSGDSADRDVSIYLPPSYAKRSTRDCI